ncbi:MAG: hydroxyneurosporene methyltransferase [Actinomycetota bacterium]|nr:hydroxyneurosporene methyltransferase [Actinomycetota bacterium]
MQQPHEIIWTLTNAVVASRALHVVAELGVADHVDDEPVSVKELATACGADVDSLDRVLRLLTAHGIFTQGGEDYGHTEPSRLLRSDHPMSMRAFARMMGLPVFSATFAQLEHSVRTGSPALELVAPEGLWPYLQEHPSERDVFGQAMTAKAAGDTAAVLGGYDFGRFGTIADIGGGRGHLLHAVLDAVPTAEGILFELPEVVETLDLQHDRMTPHAGDFFVDPLPGADAYILMEVIHDWPEAEAAAILSAIRRAAEPGANVLIIEGVVEEEEADSRVQTLDIIMLSVTGGRERTPTQLSELLEGAGFRLTRVIRTSGAMRIVEAEAM